jgi:hypothetical protein
VTNPPAAAASFVIGEGNVMLLILSGGAAMAIESSNYLSPSGEDILSVPLCKSPCYLTMKCRVLAVFIGNE